MSGRIAISALFLLLLFAGCSAPSVTPHTDAVCERHHVVMEKADVPVIYGLPFPEEVRFMAARQQRFPHVGPVFAGCTATNRVAMATIDLCPRCKSLAARWRPLRLSKNDPGENR